MYKVCCLLEKEIILVADDCTLEEASAAMKKHFIDSIRPFLSQKEITELEDSFRFISEDYGFNDTEAFSNFGTLGGSWKVFKKEDNV